jgi:hypothetical protein
MTTCLVGKRPNGHPAVGHCGLCSSSSPATRSHTALAPIRVPAPGSRRSCVVSVSSEGDPEGLFRPQVRHDLLAGSSCQPGLAGGVTVPAFTGWLRSDELGARAACGGSELRAAWPGARAGGLRRLSGRSYGRRPPRTGQPWELVGSIGALASRAGVGGARRSPSVAEGLVGAGGQAAAARCGGRWHQDLCTIPLGYRAAR